MFLFYIKHYHIISILCVCFTLIILWYIYVHFYVLIYYYYYHPSVLTIYSIIKHYTMLIIQLSLMTIRFPCYTVSYYNNNSGQFVINNDLTIQLFTLLSTMILLTVGPSQYLINLILLYKYHSIITIYHSQLKDFFIIFCVRRGLPTFRKIISKVYFLTLFKRCTNFSTVVIV